VAVLVLPFPARRPWAWLRTHFAVALDTAAAGDVDPTVLARARQGDHRAFAQIVDRYDRQLRALAYRLLGDRDRMDDALQEAYVKAFRALPGFKGDSALGTWLHRIAYNACMDELRRDRRVLPLVDDADDGRETASPLPGPAELVAERQDWRTPWPACPSTSGRRCCWSTPTGSTTTRRRRSCRCAGARSRRG